MTAPVPPFGGGVVDVVLPAPTDVAPADRPRLAQLPELLSLASDAVASEIGAQPRFGSGAARGQVWILRIGGSEPANHVDRLRGRLVSEAPSLDGLFEALGALRGLARRPDGAWPVRDAADAAELADRIQTGVADAWPSFARLGLDWAALCARWVPRVRAARDLDDALELARRWVACLGDTHTAVRPTTPTGRLPYGVVLSGSEAVVWVVPKGTAAYEAGVRPGWRLDGVDAEGWLARTGAPPHARPWLAGALALAGPASGPHAVAVWTAIGPGGRRATWSERRRPPFAEPVVEVGALPSGAGLLRITSFAPGLGARLDEVFAGPLAGVDRLVVDLRGNGGGNLLEGLALRDRFVRDTVTMGTIRTTGLGGVLGPSTAITAKPTRPGWPGRVRFLTDARTCSASEDALLGLQGLPHVDVIGRPSAGGSGRMLLSRLVPGWGLAVSTALTWDRRQHLVEGQGIPVDRHLPWTDPCAPDPVDAALDQW